MNSRVGEFDGDVLEFQLKLDGFEKRCVRESAEVHKCLESLSNDVVALDGRVSNRKVETNKLHADQDFLRQRFEAMEEKMTLLVESNRERDDQIHALENKVSLLEGHVCRCRELGTREVPIVVEESDILEYQTSEEGSFQDAVGETNKVGLHRC